MLDTGASGRRVSFKLTGLSSSRVEHEQEYPACSQYRPHGCGGPQLLAKGHGAVEVFPSHETKRLAPGRAKSQVPRVSTSRAGEGKVPGTARRTCISKAGTPSKGRPTPKLTGD